MDTGLRNELIRRDGGCVARYANSPIWKTRWPMFQGLPDPGQCRNAAGDVRDPHDVMNLTIEEVKAQSRMSKKAGYSRETSVVVCWGHHVFGHGSGAQWCTKHVVREAIREYLLAVNA
ncbi:MAG: hypothetical protein ACOYB2_10850 [Limnohabitans sp.]